MSNITSGFNKKVNLLPANDKPAINSNSTPVVGCKLDVKTLTLNESFQCQAKDLYDVFTTTELAVAFTHGPAKIEATRGGEFLLFGGNISGKFEELIRNEKIVQTWRYKQWPSGHFSHVTLQFTQKVSHIVNAFLSPVLANVFVVIFVYKHFIFKLISTGGSYNFKSNSNRCTFQRIRHNIKELERILCQ